MGILLHIWVTIFLSKDILKETYVFYKLAVPSQLDSSMD